MMKRRHRNTPMIVETGKARVVIAYNTYVEGASCEQWALSSSHVPDKNAARRGLKALRAAQRIADRMKLAGEHWSAPDTLRDAGARDVLGPVREGSYKYQVSASHDRALAGTRLVEHTKQRTHKATRLGDSCQLALDGMRQRDRLESQSDALLEVVRKRKEDEDTRAQHTRIADSEWISYVANWERNEYTLALALANEVAKRLIAN